VFHRQLRKLLRWHRLNDLVVNQKAVDIFNLVVSRISRFKLNHATTFGVLNPFNNRFLYQLFLVLKFLQLGLLRVVVWELPGST
jgi:hypothetical protein